VKPCVSAGAQNTITVNRNDYNERSVDIEQLLQEQDYMVQPFVDEIKNENGHSCFSTENIVIVWLKTPKQEISEYSIIMGKHQLPCSGSFAHRAGRSYLKSLPQPVLYARVDGVLINNSFHLMELELIEPYLFLNGEDELQENYYQALMT
jgi:hypothetical protein